MDLKKAEVSGMVVALYTSAVDWQDIRPILEKNNLSGIDPQNWYSLADLGTVFTDVAKIDGSTSNFVSWGMKVGQLTVEQTAEDMSYADFILQMNNTYHFFHRGEGMGDVLGDQISEKEFTLTSTSPYHDDFEYGLYFRQAQILLGREGKHFTLKYDTSKPRRAEGGSVSVYRILVD